jgi:hypothetical protein
MLLLALVFFGAGVFVLKVKRRCPRSYGGRLYRVDEVAVSTVLFLLGACMLVLGIAG